MALRLDSEWLDCDPDVKPEFDASYGRLGINLNDAWLTAFETQNGTRGDRVEIPAYPLAEWIAENWWAIIFEPEKGSLSKQDAGFKTRHWLGTARDGFALPDTWLFSGGRGIVEIESKSTFLSRSRMVMPTSVSARIDAEQVETSLKSFVNSVIERLDEKNIEGTLLQNIWNIFNDLDQDERKFSRLLGAIGLSPYAYEGGIEVVLSDLLNKAPDSVAEDLCEAADQGDFFEAAEDTLRSLEALDSAPTLDLSKMFSIHRPVGNKPWRVGLAAANAVREKFGIDASDCGGGTKFFDSIRITNVLSENHGFREVEEPVVHGSVRRHENHVQMDLIRIRPESRRFDAARSCFLAWNSTSEGDRLVTRARVRDQQASRAFAAELLAPIKYIKRRVTNNVLSAYRADEIAKELSVSTAVVMWQASNNNIDVPGGKQARSS